MRPLAPSTFQYVNRKGDTYFVHQGVTRLGKPKYFASRSPSGALSEVPAGFEMGEDINGVVSVRCPVETLVPAADLDEARKKVASYRHLRTYQVRARGKEIVIYAPLGIDMIESVRKSKSSSVLDDFEPILRSFGGKMEDVLARMAAETRKQEKIRALEQSLQYDSVLRLVLDQATGEYDCHRRCYRGDDDWIFLSSGKLPALLRKYFPHLGKESMFELF